MQATLENNILNSLKILGWLNLLLFTFSIITLKGTSSAWGVIFWGTAFLAIGGTIAYYVFYRKMFSHTPKQDGIVYFRPYRLVCIIFVLMFTALQLLSLLGM